MSKYLVKQVKNSLVWLESLNGEDKGIQYIVKKQNNFKYSKNDIIHCKLEKKNTLWTIVQIYSNPDETGIRSGKGNGFLSKLIGIR